LKNKFDRNLLQHIKEPENYTFIKKNNHYNDTRYIIEFEKRALEGYRLFGGVFYVFLELEVNG
jgi:hypothetical protein